MINPLKDSILYQAYGKLLDLGEQYSLTRKKTKRDNIMSIATRLRYYLRALSYSGDFLTDAQYNNILDCIVQIAGIQQYPVAPAIPVLQPPTPTTTIIIQGTPGPRGEDGGGTDFSKINVTSDRVVDSFNITDAYAARWDYIINGAPQRAGTVIGTWTEDGLNVEWKDTSTDDVNGTTDGVEFQVVVSGAIVQLLAVVTSGTWNISGSRYFIPNNGSGVGPITNQLSNGKIYIGNPSNIATEQSVSGDISITNTGVVSITPQVIVNGDVSPTAGISVSKLAPLVPVRAVVTDPVGSLTTSVTTATEISYVSGVTSNIQVQLDSKLSVATGAISTVVTTNLTPNRAVISNPLGKIAVSGTTDTELSYLSGVTAPIQPQLDETVRGDGPDRFRIKVLDIGIWNMDTIPTVNIPHGLITANIRGVLSVTIVRDDLSFAYTAPGGISTTSDGLQEIASYIFLGGNYIRLDRLAGSGYDGANFQSTGINRGWISLLYTV